MKTVSYRPIQLKNAPDTAGRIIHFEMFVTLDEKITDRFNERENRMDNRELNRGLRGLIRIFQWRDELVSSHLLSAASHHSRESKLGSS